MKGKVFMLIVNVIYLSATIIWWFIDKTFEPIVAFIGGIVSIASFYVANGNSLSVKIGKIERQINQGDKSIYYENNSK